MMRGFMSRLRLTLVGPNLNELTRLRPDEVHNLKLLSSEDPVLRFLKSQTYASAGGAAAGATGASALSTELEKTILELKRTVAELSERVEVLERVNYKHS